MTDHPVLRHLKWAQHFAFSDHRLTHFPSQKYCLNCISDTLSRKILQVACKEVRPRLWRFPTNGEVISVRIDERILRRILRKMLINMCKGVADPGFFVDPTYQHYIGCISLVDPLEMPGSGPLRIIISGRIRANRFRNPGTLPPLGHLHSLPNAALPWPQSSFRDPGALYDLR